MTSAFFREHDKENHHCAYKKYTILPFAFLVECKKKNSGNCGTYLGSRVKADRPLFLQWKIFFA